MIRAAEPPKPEVRPYLKRLLLAIFLGMILMASTATWAFLTYGKKLESAPPLPSGTPPMTPLPRTTR